MVPSYIHTSVCTVRLYMTYPSKCSGAVHMNARINSLHLEGWLCTGQETTKDCTPQVLLFSPRNNPSKCNEFIRAFTCTSNILPGYERSVLVLHVATHVYGITRRTTCRTFITSYSSTLLQLLNFNWQHFLETGNRL